MQPKHLQALIDIQANNIADLHDYIRVLKESARETESVIERAYYYKGISKLTRRIAKLVVLQRALKDALHEDILDERFMKDVVAYNRAMENAV